jgi:formate dehydrogenase alpha subunit
MSRNDATINLSIDNSTFSVKKGITILQAAEQNNIYIPTLCAYRELTPHGGCRMCIVEVEGMRNLPTACTTPVEEGMIIRTRTSQVQAMRMEILQLFMSEHTSSCLICDEKDECKRFMPTIRKAGVTTGCRYCPNDGQCEFQTVAEKLGVTEIKYPIYYRGTRVETEDPFYDRDYNLCILCGRCVRVCQEIRTANVLAFKNRGRQTTIGPAYGRSHLEAGCEFCGACVSVCPTGTLREKTRAWEGKPDGEEITTCSFCGVGCQVHLQIKGDRVIGSLPASDHLVNEGQLCVKGRFCGTELANGPLRLKNPYRVLGDTKAEISWDVATESAAEKLASCRPEDFGMLVSPNCGNEDLYVAQKFVRVAMHSHNIDTSARLFYGSGLSAYANLLRMSVPLSELQKSSVILCVGLDSRFARSVVGVAIRRAIKRGAKIVTIHPRHHNLAVVADKWLQPIPGEELGLLQSLAEMTGPSRQADKLKTEANAHASNHQGDLSSVAQLLRDSTAPAILVGSEFLQYEASAEILEAVACIAKNIRAGVLPLPSHNNLLGSIIMGAYAELLPGGYSITDDEKSERLASAWNVELSTGEPHWCATTLSRGKRLKVLYLVGETSSERESSADYVIFQNIYPPDNFCRADLVLPAAAYTEVDGSYINGEGRVQRVKKGVTPPGGATPDWQILCRIAQKMGVSGFDFSSVEQIRGEIDRVTGKSGRFGELAREHRPLEITGEFLVGKPEPRKTAPRSIDYPFLLAVSAVEHSHRGFPLSTWVEGSKMLLTEELLEINPEDAEKAGLVRGDEVVITSDHLEQVLPVRLVPEQPVGTLHASLREFTSFNPNPQPVRIRRRTCSG